MGDVIKALELANEIRTRFVDAHSQFKAISNEVKSLSIILDDVNIVLPQRDLNNEQKKQFSSIIEGCYNVLNTLREMLEKYQELGSDPKSYHPDGLRNQIQRGWKRIKWKPEDVENLRSGISSNISLLIAFYEGLAMKAVSEIKGVVDRLHERQDDQESRVILDWLSPVNYHTQQHDFLGRRQEGTGNWLLDSDEFKSWLEISKQILFCQGIPAAGKTIISSIVIDHLKTVFKNKANVGVAYLYCNYRQQQQQHAKDLLSSLLQQLAQGQSSVPAEVKILYGHHRTTQTRPSINEIKDVLKSTIQLYSRVFIIVDALDECEVLNGAYKSLLSELFDLKAKAEVNLFATSRFIPDIRMEFLNKGSILLEIRASGEDLQRYLNGQMSRLPRCVLRSRLLQEEITAEIIKAADGMFLLATLYLDSLVDKTTPRMVKRALENLPKGSNAVDQSYDNAMERIQGQEAGFWNLAKLVLSWIVCAERPLTTLELQHALAVEAGDVELGEDNFQEIEEMVSVCAGLVTVDERSDIVRLMHFTTQKYFERTQTRWFPKSQREIATTCVTYLSFNAFEKGFCLSDEEYATRLRLYPLYIYAARKLGHHIRKALMQVEDLVLDFYKSKYKVFAASQAIMAYKYGPKDSKYSQDVLREFNGVNLAAYHGLEETIFALLSNGHSSDTQDEHSQLPLPQAVLNRNEAGVKPLLAKDGIDPDIKDTDGQTPLAWAAANGQEAVVKILLAQNGVDPDFKDKYGQTPLSRAAASGHEAVVKLFLAKIGVDPDAKNIDPVTPLSWAAMWGHEAVVTLLLAKDSVNPDCKDNYNQTPLSFAARDGHETVVKLLLAKEGVGPDSKDINGRTPLIWAAMKGHEGVVKLLLAKDGVNPDSKDVRNRTPLSWAVMKRHKAVAELLQLHLSSLTL